MKELTVWREKDTWYFDDKEKGIEREPFVSGSSEIITTMKMYLGIKTKKVRIQFSDEEDFEYRFVLDHEEYKELNWNLYRDRLFKMRGWLCPVLYRYFDEAPKILYLNLLEG